jgi:hypothetical protein
MNQRTEVSRTHRRTLIQRAIDFHVSLWKNSFQL